MLLKRLAGFQSLGTKTSHLISLYPVAGPVSAFVAGDAAVAAGSVALCASAIRGVAELKKTAQHNAERKNREVKNSVLMTQILGDKPSVNDKR
jgi:hypothetical protein